MLHFNTETGMFELWIRGTLSELTPDEWFKMERTIEMADEKYFSTVEYIDVECMNCGMVLGATETQRGWTPEYLCVECSKETTVAQLKAEREGIKLNG